MENFLFIGGHHDGLKIPVADDVEFIQLSVSATDRETYIRDVLAVGIDAFITFYRHEELTPEEVLDLLAKHYKAWALNRAVAAIRKHEDGR